MTIDVAILIGIFKDPIQISKLSANEGASKCS